MSPALKVLAIVFAIIAVIIGLLVFAYYYFFVGITPKAKYEKCADRCEEIMLIEGNIPLCKLRCQEISDYSPTSSSDSSSTNESTKSESSTKNDSGDLEDIEYYCKWSWPQAIIDANTKEVIQDCTYAEPYCFYDDKTYQSVACCADAEHTNCTLLKDM